MKRKFLVKNWFIHTYQLSNLEFHTISQIRMDLKSTYHFSHRQTWISKIFHGFNSPGLLRYKNIHHKFLSTLQFEHVDSNFVYLASFLNLMLMFFALFSKPFSVQRWLSDVFEINVTIFIIVTHGKCTSPYPFYKIY